MKIVYHVYERSQFAADGEDRCEWCGNKETAATGSGHVATQGEANRRNREQKGHGENG